MLTARAQATDRQAALAAGADRFLPKPFSPLELASLVESLLAGRSLTSPKWRPRRASDGGEIRLG